MSSGTAFSHGQYNEVIGALQRAIPKAIEEMDPVKLITALQRSGEALEEGLREVFENIVVGASRKILKLISGGHRLVISTTSGKRFIADAKNPFSRYLDPSFKNDRVEGPAAGETNVAVYELVEDATLADMFGRDPKRLCLTQDQIIRFCEDHRSWLRKEGYATFFLYESDNQFFVADVFFGFDGLLNVSRDPLEYSRVWRAGFRHRVVLPELA